MSDKIQERIKELLKAKKTEKEIEIIIATEAEIDMLFETVIESLKVSLESYKKDDMASLNVSLDNLKSSKGHISDLEKKINEIKTAKEQPGAAIEPPSEPIETPIEEPIDNVPPIEEEA